MRVRPRPYQARSSDRPQLDGAAEAGLRLVQLALLLEQEAQVVPALGSGRIHRGDAAEGGDGAVGVAQLRAQVAHGGQRAGAARARAPRCARTRTAPLACGRAAPDILATVASHQRSLARASHRAAPGGQRMRVCAHFSHPLLVEIGQADVAVGEADGEVRHQAEQERHDRHVLVEHDARRDEADRANHRPRDHAEQLVDHVLAPRRQLNRPTSSWPISAMPATKISVCAIRRRKAMMCSAQPGPPGRPRHAPSLRAKSVPCGTL